MVIIFIFSVHILMKYNSLFKLRIGFIYHPQTDFLFKVNLKPEVHTWSKWKYLIPFAYPDGYRIFSAQLKGEFTRIETAQNKLDAIRKRSLEISKDPGKMRNFLKSKEYNLSPERLRHIFSEALIIEIYHYAKFFTPDVFPDGGKGFEFLKNAPSKELEKVDAVITILRLEEPRVIDVFVLQNAVFITGDTAFFIDDKTWF